MNTHKMRVRAATLALFGSFASAALGANYTIDADPTTAQLDALAPGRYALMANGSPVILVPAGNFTDHWTFALDEASLDVGAGGLNFIFQGTLFGAQITLLDLTSGGSSVTPSSATSGQLHFADLGAGTYDLKISGVVSNVGTGAYSGMLDVAQVPIPGALFSTLAGIGLLGSVALRRRNI